VVSEETGDLSVAAHGEIHRGVSLRELDERINAHFGVSKQGPPANGEPAEIQPEERPKAVEKAG